MYKVGKSETTMKYQQWSNVKMLRCSWEWIDKFKNTHSICCAMVEHDYEWIS